MARRVAVTVRRSRLRHAAPFGRSISSRKGAAANIYQRPAIKTCSMWHLSRAVERASDKAPASGASRARARSANVTKNLWA
jgi:hypothetical protein